MIWDYYIYISFFASFFYIAVMMVCAYGWRKLPAFQLDTDVKIYKTKISVIIAARNEADNIAVCLKSIFAQTYPKNFYEIIVVNDHSEDDTFAIAKGFDEPNLRVLQLADYGVKGAKKKAIEIGVKEASGDLIVATDADCIAQENWLHLLADFYEKGDYKFIAAPVNFHNEKNTFEKCQSLDFLGLMAVTGAGIALQKFNMCNGANLAYERNVFFEVDGFKGIEQLASGDDMLLMQKIALKYPDRIGYLKNTAATVFTQAKPTIASFINQRVRWASKMNSYKDFLMTSILVMVFGFCCNIPLSLLLSIFLGKKIVLLFLSQCLIKATCDMMVLYPVCTFFNRKDLKKVFFPAFWGHLTYVIVVGVLANFLYNYEWKGRWVR
jgi:cellulose synthase/poly-beta-1,6-N-acetylglucosamine synthase-like glycosyltransferase